MGGVFCFRDKGMFAQKYEGIGHLLKEKQILAYGNDSYGGSKSSPTIKARTLLLQGVIQKHLEA